MPQDRIIILAGGASIGAYDLKGLEKRGTVIGVNDSFLNFPECFAGVTMDRVWMEARADRVISSGKPFFVRNAAVKFIQDKAQAENIRLFECEETNEMSFDPEQLNGTSSGMCAFNLALQLKPDVIYLFGFDMNGGRWYEYDFKNWDPKGNKFTKWIRQFEEIAEKIKVPVLNVNHMSALKCFPTITYEKFLNDTQPR